MPKLQYGLCISLLVASWAGCSRSEGPSPETSRPGQKGPGMGVPSPGGRGMGGMGGTGTDSPLVGNPALDFTLPDVAGEAFTLSEAFADQFVVIYFYKGGW